MANEIPRIGVNTNAVGNSYEGQSKKAEVKPETNNAPEVQAASQQKQIAPGDVLSLMAQHATVKPQKTYDIGKYVNAEQAARIAAMMGNFESAVAKGLKAIEEEGLILSDQAAHALAASMVE